MIRLSSLAVVLALTGFGITALFASDARAQAPAPAEPLTQAQIAEQLNTEGKQAMYANNFAEAAQKFQQAVSRVPEPKYFVNLCTALLQIGKLDAALTACNAVDLNGSSEQKSRAATLIARINEEARKQNLQLHPDGGGCGGADCRPDVRDPAQSAPDRRTATADPSRPPPPPNYAPAIGRPLDQSLVAGGPPDHRYTWTLGADLFGGGGQVGQPDFYGTAFVGLRLKADYLVNPPARVGVEAYLQISHLDAGRGDIAVDTLDIIDFGIAGYKHICPGGTSRLCITPLAGAHISSMSPAGEMDGSGSQVFNYTGLGARLEVSIDLAFGRRFEHVLSLIGGANLYTAVLASSGPFTVAEVGLDKPGATGYIGFGYTHRFNTPLGGAPFIVLE
jgi:hypothetical protein